jgi:hypothetical protein
MSELWGENLNFFSYVVSLHCGVKVAFMHTILKTITCFSISFLMFVTAINHYMAV